MLYFFNYHNIYTHTHTHTHTHTLLANLYARTYIYMFIVRTSCYNLLRLLYLSTYFIPLVYVFGTCFSYALLKLSLAHSSNNYSHRKDHLYTILMILPIKMYAYINIQACYTISKHVLITLRTFV